MAYRELGVIELREVWRRYSAGDEVRAIARGTGVDRKTIAKYVAAAVAAGLSRGAPPPSEAQLAAFVRGLRGTPLGRPAALPERLAPYQAQIAAWLADGLRLTKIHRRLREQGRGVPYSSLHRFAQAQCGFGAPGGPCGWPIRRPARRPKPTRAVGPVAGSRHQFPPVLCPDSSSRWPSADTPSCGSRSAKTCPSPRHRMVLLGFPAVTPRDGRSGCPQSRMLPCSGPDGPTATRRPT